MGVFTAINDPSVYFQQLLYTGNGSASSRSLVNEGNSNLKPDWLWIKCRSAADNHVILDSSRGNTKQLKLNGTDAEDTVSHVASFNTDGFSLTSTDQAYNGNGQTYVAYQWKINDGTEGANTTKSINADIQVNNTAGISIIRYVGNETGSQTLPHGLSSPWWNGADCPSSVLIKRRIGGTGDWHACQSPMATYYGGWGDDSGAPRTMMPNQNYYAGDGGNGTDGNTARYRADMDATTIYLGHDSTYNGTGGMIAYCFKNVPGFSHFSGYVGNGNADGPEIFLGFKPVFLMFKRWNQAAGWATMVMEDGEPIVYKVRPDTNDAQGNPSAISVTSSGFKVVSSSSDYNAAGGRYAYWAWADQPLVTSTGIPSMAGITGGSG